MTQPPKKGILSFAFRKPFGRSKPPETETPGYLPEFVVTPDDAYSNRFRDLFDYEEPQHIQNLKRYQEERGLPNTGFLGPSTRGQFKSEFKESPEDLQRIGELNMRLEELKGTRKSYQDKIREQSRQLGPELGMKKSVFNNLKKQKVSQLSECIGGVCTFLDEKVEPGLFKNATQEGIYYSNNTFEQNAAEEGWQQHINTDLTKPDVGDIIVRYNDLTNTRHAVLVSDYDPDKGEYTILDNNGGSTKRMRTFSEKEMLKKYNIGKKTSKGSPEGFFYRRTNFGDGNIADVQRELSGLQKFRVPEEYRNTNQYDHRDFELTHDIDDDDYSTFVNGINSSVKGSDKLYKDIPDEHLKALALIAGGISGNESTFGDDTQLAFEKGIKYNFSKAFRNLTHYNSTDKKAPLSVGIAQINPSMLDENILQKYFSDTKHPDKIAKKIASDPELQGKIAMEELAVRYRRFRENPNLYGNDPEKFFYALTRSWKNPSFGLTESGREYLQNWDVDYSNQAMKNIDEHFDISEKEMGGSVGCDTCLQKFTTGGENPFWTPGMMFDKRAIDNSFEQEAVKGMTEGYDWGGYNYAMPEKRGIAPFDPLISFKTDFEPAPIYDAMSGFDKTFDSNNNQISKDRAPQIRAMMKDGSQMVNPQRVDNSIQLPSNMPGVQDRASSDPSDPTKREGNPMMRYAPHLATGLMGILGNVSGRDQERAYEQMLQRMGNTDSRQSSSPENVFGNYTPNVGLGSNFRPNQTGFRNFEEGGEYEMNEDELRQFMANGGEVEFL